MKATTLSTSARAFLPTYARAVLEAAVRGETAPTAAEAIEAWGLETPAELHEKRGIFVTLTRHGALRGCIGYIEGVVPLGDAVRDNALSAAFKDPRFSPITASELPDLDLEISVLTPLSPVDDWHDIETPRHGVVLSKGGRRAVFLPQVATEMGWDTATTLTQLALKAGLAADDWREGAQYSVFEAEIIHEEPKTEPPTPGISTP